MRKFLVSDYDRTFHLNDESMEDNILKVEKFRKLGNIFAIATGRSYTDFIPKKEEFSINYDYLIINHGATILDKNHRVLKSFPIDNTIKKKIVEEFNLVDNENLFACQLLEGRVSIKSDNLTKIHIKYQTKEDQEMFNNIINTKYFKYCKSYPIFPYSIEIISSLTDKKTAIEEIIKRENIDKEEVITVGDSYNDLEMLEYFDGYVIENGEEKVKSIVPKRCSSIAELIDEVIGGKNA